ENPPLHAVDNFVVDPLVSRVAPPGEHVRLREGFEREAVLGLLERRHTNLYLAPRQPRNRIGPDGVHPVRIELADGGTRQLVDVFVPEGDGERQGGGGGGGTENRGQGRGRKSEVRNRK